MYDGIYKVSKKFSPFSHLCCDNDTIFVVYMNTRGGVDVKVENALQEYLRCFDQRGHGVIFAEVSCVNILCKCHFAVSEFFQWTLRTIFKSPFKVTLYCSGQIYCSAGKCFACVHFICLHHISQQIDELCTNVDSSPNSRWLLPNKTPLTSIHMMYSRCLHPPSIQMASLSF